MAKRTKGAEENKFKGNNPKRTSIGKSCRSKPKNKSKKRNWKRSKGQGDGRRR